MAGCLCHGSAMTAHRGWCCANDAARGRTWSAALADKRIKPATPVNIAGVGRTSPSSAAESAAA